MCFTIQIDWRRFEIHYEIVYGTVSEIDQRHIANQLCLWMDMMSARQKLQFEYNLTVSAK